MRIRSRKSVFGNSSLATDAESAGKKRSAPLTSKIGILPPVHLFSSSFVFDASVQRSLPQGLLSDLLFSPSSSYYLFFLTMMEHRIGMVPVGWVRKVLRQIQLSFASITATHNSLLHKSCSCGAFEECGILCDICNLPEGNCWKI